MPQYATDIPFLRISALLAFLVVRSCPDCGIDALEGNDFVAGIDPTPGRDGMEVAFSQSTPLSSCDATAVDLPCSSHLITRSTRTLLNNDGHTFRYTRTISLLGHRSAARNKNGEPVCKKHNSPKDGCFAFKKQIVKLSKESVSVFAEQHS